MVKLTRYKFTQGTIASVGKKYTFDVGTRDWDAVTILGMGMGCGLKGIWVWLVFFYGEKGKGHHH